MRIGRALATGATLLAMGVAACGGDDGGGAEESDISKADFVEQANAICTKGSQETTKAFAGVGPTTDPSEVASLVENELVPSIRQQLSDIRDLGFPEGDGEELDAMLSDTEAILDDMESDPEAFVAQTEDPFAEVNEELKAYGLTACGSV